MVVSAETRNQFSRGIRRLIAVFTQSIARLFLASRCNNYHQRRIIRAMMLDLSHYNSNAHDASPFYENLPAAEAFTLAERFEFYYKPKSASWLNMIEQETSTSALIRNDKAGKRLDAINR